jgi:threonine synthase
MRYYSLAGQAPLADFRTATLEGQAPDKGLYFPSAIPTWTEGFLQALPSMPKEEMALQVMKPYVGDCIPERALHRIVSETLDFPIPLVGVCQGISSLELFHGPTLAFKDVGARFMSRCLGWFSRDNDRKTVVLVATSGDTGGAVAHGFHDVPGIDVVILYPSGKVSPVQEKQLTTLGGNIHALEVSGDFDDCQRLVKTAFADKDLRSKRALSSANSINVARWLPQQLYYVLAWQQWPHRPKTPVISVPSGNFGNLCAGMMAWKSGLPVSRFIAACNANDTVPRFLKGEDYRPGKAVATHSNAMDVADPSNFVRILEILGGSRDACREMISAYSISDEETVATIRRIHRACGYLLDPHGAVGYLALEQWRQSHPQEDGFFLGTAHPVKFPHSVEAATGNSVPVPEQVREILAGIKRSVRMPAEYDDLKSFIEGLA